MIPEYLLSTCMERMGIGMSACPGSCGDEVRVNPETGRWFITMGHPGFNSTENNGAGYPTELAAREAVVFFASSSTRIESGDQVVLKRTGKIYRAAAAPYYYGWENGRLFGYMVVDYQAINPKTGKGWQKFYTVPAVQVEPLR